MYKRFLGWDCANKTLAWSHVDIDVHIYSKISMLGESMAELIDSYMGKGISRRLLRLTPNEQQQLTMNLQDPEFLSEVLFIFDALNYFVSKFIQYISLGVVDVLCGAKVDSTNDVQRTRALWEFLTNSEVKNTKNMGLPIIEHQPNKIGSKTNSKSTAVSQQLAFYYIEHSPIMIDPRLKNNLSLSADLHFDDFLTKEINKKKIKATKGTDKSVKVTTKEPTKEDLKSARYSARKKHSKFSFLYLINVFELDYLIEDISLTVMDDLADSTMEILAHLVENKLFV